jgi:2,3,4,5-tetrahydropyridine-2-carboxylate N-succinyltransferase
LNLEALRRTIERLSAIDRPPAAEAREALDRLLDALESGEVRAAERGPEGWSAAAWVKSGILLGFRLGTDRSMALPPVFHFRDRDTFPPQDPFHRGAGVRVVPGGTTVRRGAHLGQGVVVMPPAFVNVGAFVGAGTMVDSHALVGSCAQIGCRVHLSAAAQIGGVLEPIGATPVVVEDEAFVGGGCGIYEGTLVGRGAVLAPGVVLTRSTAIHDLVNERVWTADGDHPLAVPPGAVVVPGARPARGAYAARLGLQLQAPIIVKYRDGSTEAAVELEEALR